MQNRCRTYAEPMQNLCRTYAEPMQNRCRTNAEPMQSQCTTYAEPMQNQYRTYAEPSYRIVSYRVASYRIVPYLILLCLRHHDQCDWLPKNVACGCRIVSYRRVVRATYVNSFIIDLCNGMAQNQCRQPVIL